MRLSFVVFFSHQQQKERLAVMNEQCLDNPTELQGDLFKVPSFRLFALSPSQHCLVFVQAQGTATPPENSGPYGEGDFIRLPPVCGYTERERFEWTFGRKTYDMQARGATLCNRVRPRVLAHRLCVCLCSARHESADAD